MKRTLARTLGVGIWLGSVLLAGAMPQAFAVGTGGTGLKSAYVQGAVAPGGGIVVGGTRFNAAHARVTVNGIAGLKAQAVRTGVVAQIAGAISTDGTRGIANAINVSRVLLSRLSFVGTGGTGLKAAGLTLAPQNDAVLVGFRAVSDLAVGDTVDVYGFVDVASLTVRATRIERVTAAAASELRGVITAVTSSTLVVDGISIDATHATLSGFDGGPQVGDSVVVEGAVVSDGIVASSVTATSPSEPADDADAEVEGSVLSIVGPGDFFVDSVEIDATGATVSGGTLADIVVGSQVQVHGAIVDGVLVADSVEIDNASDDASDDGGESADDGNDGSDDGQHGRNGGGPD